MTMNSNGPEMVETPRVREASAVAADATVAQLVARPVPVRTAGRVEFAARCPECRDWHRHVSLGQKDAPCGAHYLLEFKTKLKGAA